MIKTLLHVDYITVNSDGTREIHRGDLFDHADYDASLRSLIVWKDGRTYVIDNVVALSMSGDVFNE